MNDFKLIIPYEQQMLDGYIGSTNHKEAKEIKTKVSKECIFSEFGIYRNENYSVSVYPCIRADENQPLAVYMKIRNIDWSAIHDWRDFQEIKNIMFGEECEGVEVYPPESLLQDTANTFWMVVFVDPTYRSFFTLTSGRNVTENDGNPLTQQRPFTKMEFVKVPRKLRRKRKRKR